MKAEIEPVSGVMRVWVSDRASYGDPYSLSLTVRWVGPTSVELLGLTKMTCSLWRAIKAECLAWGITKVLCVRYRHGGREEKWITLKTRGRNG